MQTGSKPNDLRIGFYICHCGHNIAAMVDCPEVAKYVEHLPGVALSRDYKYMCSDPGQELVQKDIQEFGLNRVVVASCSPLLHEHTFRAAVEAGGLNPFFFHAALRALTILARCTEPLSKTSTVFFSSFGRSSVSTATMNSAASTRPALR